ncbi:hypothetical protein OL67_003927 (plasmid) [Phaeobacter piscinae]|nr:hypothetical protein OL67_003927 [Phaeobacter piscinae]
MFNPNVTLFLILNTIDIRDKCYMFTSDEAK